MRLTHIEKPVPNGGSMLPNLNDLPIRVPRKEAADLLTRYRFKISERTLERANLVWTILNGRAHTETAALFEWADAKMAETPRIAGSRRVTRNAPPEAEQHAA